MSVKEILTCSGKGLLDSLKGVYWLYLLDRAQARAVSCMVAKWEAMTTTASHYERAMWAQQERTTFSEFSKNSKKKPTTGVNKPSQRRNKEEPRLLNRVAQCCMLNGVVFGMSIVVFKSLLLPLLQTLLLLVSSSTSTTFWGWLQFLLQWTFDGLWVLPLFLLSRVVNALWFQDIGSLAYRYSLGRPKTIASISTFIADNLFSIIIQALFLIQALLLSYLLPPLTGVTIATLVYHTHTSLLYSLYAFEYKWVQMGMPLHQRLNFLEANWPYFLGFGLPLSLITGWHGDWVVGGCVFAVSFPVFIIAGNEGEVGGCGCPRLRLFTPVVYLSNLAFKENKCNKKPR